MKVIALRNFLNNCGLECPAPVHPREVTKGTVFEIGPETVKTFEDFKKSKDKNLRATAELAALLIHARCIWPADEATVKRVNEEVELEKKREANHARANRELGGQQIAAELLAVFNNAARFNAKPA